MTKHEIHHNRHPIVTKHFNQAHHGTHYKTGNASQQASYSHKTFQSSTAHITKHEMHHNRHSIVTKHFNQAHHTLQNMKCITVENVNTRTLEAGLRRE